MSQIGVTGCSASHKYHMTKFTLFTSLLEGGWATTATQTTKITPKTVQLVVKIMHKLVDEFNHWLELDQETPALVQVGPPTGSGFYHMQDPAHKEYGDVDLQMIAPNPWGLGHASYSSEWNQLWSEWVARHQPDVIRSDLSTPGHPIIQLPDGGLVQVDFMWHEPAHAKWGLARSVPPRGLKGMLNGNMFSVLGQMLHMSLQHAGVQVKTDASGQVVPFSKRKNTMLHTITTDPDHMFSHILSWCAQKPLQDLRMHDLLKQNPGVKWPDPDVHVLIKGTHGLAKSFTLNHMWGKGVLSNYANETEFLNEFWNTYQAKAEFEIHNPKRAKAETPEAQARAQRDIASIQSGLDQISLDWHKLID